MDESNCYLERGGRNYASLISSRNKHQSMGAHDMENTTSNTETQETDRYLSQPELCKYFNYSTSTIRRYKKLGMPSIGTGRLRRYHVGTVLQWLSSEHT